MLCLYLKYVKKKKMGGGWADMTGGGGIKSAQEGMEEACSGAT